MKTTLLLLSLLFTNMLFGLEDCTPFQDKFNTLKKEVREIQGCSYSILRNMIENMKSESEIAQCREGIQLRETYDDSFEELMNCMDRERIEKGFVQNKAIIESRERNKYMKKGRKAVDIENYDEALVYYQKVLSMSANEKSKIIIEQLIQNTYLSSARQKEKNQNYDEAIIAYIKALGINPKNYYANSGLAGVYLIQKDIGNALKYNSEATINANDSSEVKYSSYQLRDIKTAEEELLHPTPQSMPVILIFPNILDIYDEIVQGKMSHVKYPLDEEIKKQDLVRIALHMANIEVPSDYICQNIYPQISADFPNNWACRVAEIARQKNIISLTNPDFLGDSGLPRIEALEILLKAKNIPLKKSTRSKFSDVTDPKQIQIVNTALALGFVSPNATFRPDEQIMHGEAFYMIKNISKYK